ncbi:hypothetical protein J6590_085160 [Homalodisca vitripennis]|nr:hypothetical protein J6590_085160 [Homalodisca vitripennis]
METIQLSGQSSRHVFSLSSTYINFGFRTFTEVCEEVIELSNMSQLPFTFRVSSAADAAVPSDMADVELGRLTIQPSYGRVNAQTSISIYVRFYPGLTGEFQQQFTIQVGYLEPVIVLVTGYGVLPQVSVNQAHISRPRLPIYLGYKAVASLTARRFQHTISCHHLSVDLTQPPSDDILSDWVVINFTDKFPTNNDIWLAIERLIASSYFKENPQFLSVSRSRNNNKRTPQLVFPGYVLGKHESARPRRSHCSLNGTDRHALLYLLEPISAVLDEIDLVISSDCDDSSECSDVPELCEVVGGIEDVVRSDHSGRGSDGEPDNDLHQVTAQQTTRRPAVRVPPPWSHLGSVIVGTTTEATVMVENRGLVRADVTLAFSVPEKKLKQDGFFINFQNHMSLPIGRSVPMIITIRPSPARYSGKQEIVHFTLYIEVNNGGVIPMYVKALLTVPYVTLDQKTLDFGDVHCGEMIFDLTPTEGVLEPFQSQILNVAFRPPPFTGIVATAVCSVLGGPMETIQLSGQSSRHVFSLSSTYINFGFRTFTEVCEEVIELSNMSQLPFTFRVSSAADAAVPSDMADVELGRLTIQPSYGRVNAQTSISIYVRFYPGLTGEFQQQFTIQIMLSLSLHDAKNSTTTV